MQPTESMCITQDGVYVRSLIHTVLSITLINICIYTKSDIETCMFLKYVLHKKLSCITMAIQQTFGTKRISSRKVVAAWTSRVSNIAPTLVSSTAIIVATSTMTAKRKAYVASPTCLDSLSSGMLIFLF